MSKFSVPTDITDITDIADIADIAGTTGISGSTGIASISGIFGATSITDIHTSQRKISSIISLPVISQGILILLIKFLSKLLKLLIPISYT